MKRKFAVLIILSASLSFAQTPPNAIVIEREELEKGLYELDLFSILSALSLKTGITFKSSSDVGAEDWLLIRGLPRDSSRTVLVLVDGMPVNDPFSEAVEFEHLPPIEMIEKIIVYKQPLPPRFGGYHAVVEIRTVNKGIKSKIDTAVGNYGTFVSSINIGKESQKISYIFSTEFIETDNLTGVRRTPPKEKEIYGSRYYRKTMPILKVNYKFTKNTITSLLIQYVDSTKFFSDIVFRGERENRKRSLTKLNLTHKWSPKEWILINLNLFRRNESYNLNLIMHPDVTKQVYLKQGMRTLINIKPLDFTIIKISGEFTDMSVIFRDTKHKKSIQFYGASFEQELNFPFGINIHVGLRYDGHSESKSKTSPFVTLMYNFTKQDYIYAMYGKNIRWPSLSEFLAKNPNLGLKPEEAESVEAGIFKTLFNRFTYKISLFKTIIYGYPEPFIDKTKTPPEFFLINSTSRILSEGVESEINFPITKTTNIFLNHTYNKVVEIPDRNIIDYGGPTNLINMGFSHVTKRYRLFTSLRYGDSAKGIQRMFGEPTSLSPYVIVDLALKINLTESTDFKIRISNLLDVKYETFEGRPMFRRTIVAGISYTF